LNFWTPDSIKSASGGIFVTRPEVTSGAAAFGGAPMLGVSIDSRTLMPGQVFIAIHGDRFDGHDFIAGAIERGASMLIVDRESPPTLSGQPPTTWAELGRRISIVKVADTRKALSRLAAAYRESLKSTKVIAVCGSNGKTTTTALIASVLSTKFRGTASAKSFNNDIGVPLTILSAKPGDQFLICEVGSNAPGEIATLGEVVLPDIAVITSIGREHLAGFGSLEGVAREEASILRFLRPPPGGTAILTADAPLLDAFVKFSASVLTFGHRQGAGLRLTAFEHFASPTAIAAAEREASGAAPIADSIRFVVNSRWTFTVPTVGEHNALNAMAALAVGRRMGMTEDEIAAGLAAARPPEMRLAQTTIKGIRLINDAYNANPDSTLAALRTFAAVHAGADRRVVILGDNLEQGDSAAESHREFGRVILELGCIDALITVGPLAALAAETLALDWDASRLSTFENLTDGRDARIAALLKPGDAVLLKGSRGMGLERIVKALSAARAPSATKPAPSITTTTASKKSFPR